MAHIAMVNFIQLELAPAPPKQSPKSDGVEEMY